MGCKLTKEDFVKLEMHLEFRPVQFAKKKKKYKKLSEYDFKSADCTSALVIEDFLSGGIFDGRN